MTSSAQDRDLRASSTGKAAADEEWLDAHFEYVRPEHEAILRSVGMQSGWLVLDAGCGTGPHLPLLAELVGPTGRITAVDLTPENVAAARARVSRHALDCPIQVEVASLESFPLADGAVDAIWTANTLMYLTDADLPGVLVEVQRVLRAGGLLAIKETDLTTIGVHPIDPRYWNAVREGLPQLLPGVCRTRGLCHWVRRAGFVEVQQHTVLSERWAPLTTAQWRFAGEALADDVRAFWATQRDPHAPDALVSHPDFAHLEGHCVVRALAPSA